jgi:hypothetical protein
MTIKGDTKTTTVTGKKYFFYYKFILTNTFEGLGFNNGNYDITFKSGETNDSTKLALKIFGKKGTEDLSNEDPYENFNPELSEIQDLSSSLKMIAGVSIRFKVILKDSQGRKFEKFLLSAQNAISIPNFVAGLDLSKTDTYAVTPSNTKACFQLACTNRRSHAFRFFVYCTCMHVLI